MSQFNILEAALSPDFTLYTYKVAHDAGTAPNPYHGICTLAICKPRIRTVAKEGDVIVGLGCKEDEHRIVYLMVVDQVKKWDDYIKFCLANSQFKRIPENDKDNGDCIYTENHMVLDSFSGHSAADFKTDFEDGKNVLIAKRFWYFGKRDSSKKDIYLPSELEEIICNRGHRSVANKNLREPFVNWFSSELRKNGAEAPGKYGSPAIDSGVDSETRKSCRVQEIEDDQYGEQA